MVIRDPIQQGDVREISGLNKVFIPYMWMIDLFALKTLRLNKSLDEMVTSVVVSEKVIGQIFLEIAKEAVFDPNVALYWYDTKEKNWSAVKRANHDLTLTFGANLSTNIPLHSVYDSQQRLIPGCDRYAEFLYHKQNADYFLRRVPFNFGNNYFPVSGEGGNFDVNIPIAPPKPSSNVKTSRSVASATTRQVVNSDGLNPFEEDTNRMIFESLKAEAAKLR